MPIDLEDLPEYIEKLRSVARSGNPELIRDVLASAMPEDLASAIERLDTDESIEILQVLPPELAADVLVELPTENARQIVAELPDETLAHFLDILPMDDALDLREELPPERFDELLELIPVEDAQEIRRLLGYPEDSVGRFMTERFFEVSPDTTMAGLLNDVRSASDEKYETVNDVYVLSPDRHLLGLLSLRRAIRATPDVTAKTLMRTEMVTCLATDSAESAARTMSRYGFYALPVLDTRGRMVGIFTGDDAQEILQEAETEDVLALGAVSGVVEAYLSLSPWRLALKRLPWLAALFLAENLTGMVLRHYGQGDEIKQAILFLPLLLGVGGNSGSQTTTMVTRALALGEIGVRDAGIVLRKEIVASLFAGAVLGVAGFIRAIIWGADPTLCICIAISLPLIVIWASTVGSVLPITAKRMNADPAVMSAPFISTFVDATGLIIYFEVIRAFFHGRLGP